MELITALTIGFLGSFHCIGMCGPIVLALPFSGKKGAGKVWSGLIYNFGRIITYSAFGLVFGLFGKGLFLAGTQQKVSIILGIVIIIMALVPLTVSKKINPGSALGRLNSKLKSSLGHFLQKRSYPALFMIGSLNGLLPCGLVYLAIAGSVATGDPYQGALFMAFFGLGTLPIMFTVGMVANLISLNIRNKIRKAMPVFIILVGLMVIVRGMNLGIPYLSPEFNKDEPKKVRCH